MSRIESVFRKLKNNGQKAVIPYVCCGDPNLDFTEELVLALAGKGADIIELGVPYSDPVADGPTIQKASVRALENGVNLEDIFCMASRIRKKTQVPLVMMTYYNPVFVYGVERFLERARTAGIDGLIAPDLPMEESGPLEKSAYAVGMDLILLAAPTSTRERLEQIAVRSRGFIYCVSVKGVTGARENTSFQVEEMIKILREKTSLPLAVGFGISGPDTAKQAGEFADGVIIGSALIDIIERNSDDGECLSAVKQGTDFIFRIKHAVNENQNTHAVF